MSTPTLDEKLATLVAILKAAREAASAEGAARWSESIAAVEEAREMLKASMSPGFTCKACGGWTGVLKGATACRFCETPHERATG
jgi:hypothetical protein